MNHAEAEELLGAYALDALPEDEARRVEEHLRGCAEHRAMAAELRRTSGLLPLTVGEGDPSPELRARIVEAVKATQRERLAPSPATETACRSTRASAPTRAATWGPRSPVTCHSSSNSRSPSNPVSSSCRRPSRSWSGTSSRVSGSGPVGQARRVAPAGTRSVTSLSRPVLTS